MKALKINTKRQSYFITSIKEDGIGSENILTAPLTKGFLEELNSKRDSIAKLLPRNVTIEEVEPEEAWIQSFKRHAIVKVKEDSPIAEKYRIKPWHHCELIGNAMTVYIWDIRVLEQVIDLKQAMKDEAFLESLVPCTTDNFKLLHIGWKLQATYEAKTAQQSPLTDAMLTEIAKRAL